MKFAPIFLAAAIGVAAHPSGHAHLHRSVEARGEFVMAKKPTPPAPSPPAPKPSPPAPAPAPAVASPKPAPAAQANQNNIVGDVLNTVTSFAANCAKSKRATIAQIGYKGNTGTPDNFGCNLMLVKSTAAPQYQYSVKLQNAGGASKCVLWNKIGPKGLINGFFKGQEVMQFDLAAGATQYIALDKNSQGGLACTEGNSLQVTNFGQFASTWFEFDVGNASNGGVFSGADASCLVPAKYGLPIAGMKVCAGSTCSIINSGGGGSNAYLAGMEDADGVGINTNAQNVEFDVTVNY